MLNNMTLRVEPRPARRSHDAARVARPLRPRARSERHDGRHGRLPAAGGQRRARPGERGVRPVAAKTRRTRESYGPGLGQELLLARRLCEAGAGFVTLNNGYWDHHGGIIPGCKQLCPPLDHAVAAFIDDVHASAA